MNEEGRIREKGKDGVLLHAGFVWSQPIPSRERMMKVTLWASASAAIVTSPFFLMYLRHSGPLKVDGLNFLVLTTFVLSCAVLVGILVFGFSFPNAASQKAGVSFSSVGEIWVTRKRKVFDDYDRLRPVCLKYGTDEVASIELAPMKNVSGGHYRHGSKDGFAAYDVWLHFLSGEQFCVGEYLTEDQALVIVEELKLARREMRYSASVA